MSPRGADAVGSLLRGERRYGRDALSNTSSECVVAKANEADCGAQTPKSKHVRKGEVVFRVHNAHARTKSRTLCVHITAAGDITVAKRNVYRDME